MRRSFLILQIALFFFLSSLEAQYVEKVNFDPGDSTDGFYLAVKPKSGNIKGVLVLVSSYFDIESLLPETKLHNVGYVNDLLTISVSMKQKIYADKQAIERMNTVLNDVIKRYGVDTSKFAVAGFDFAGTIVLRYVELCYQYPDKFPVKPKAVFGIECPVDLFGLWQRCERAVKKNYTPEAVFDAKYLLDLMTKDPGPISANGQRYAELNPFNKDDGNPGNEQYLKDVAVRLYFDTDIEWQLSNRRNSYYDTDMPDGSELISRLLLSGKKDAEFIAAKRPGMRNSGIRRPVSLSIVDEPECIQWIKKVLDIFDPNTWVASYQLSIPENWGTEHFAFPIEFAPGIPYKGTEDLRFAPGWGDTTSAEHWTYSYLWWLQGKPAIDAAHLQDYLKSYYDGLVGRNIISRNIPSHKIVPTKTSIKKIKTDPGDVETYNGTISMLNYLKQQPIVLNCMIHIKDCNTQNHTAVYVEISPQPLSHAIWKTLNSIGESFKCAK